MDRVPSEVNGVRTPRRAVGQPGLKSLGKHFTLGDKAFRHLTKWAIYTATIIVVYNAIQSLEQNVLKNMLFFSTCGHVVKLKCRDSWRRSNKMLMVAQTTA